MAKNKVTCPKCKSTNIAEVVYGMPDYNDELVKALDEGTIELGGCLVGENDPTRHCNSCQTDFGGEDDESY